MAFVPRRAVVAVLAIVVAACGGAATPMPVVPAPPKPAAHRDATKVGTLDAQAVLRAVVQVRGLPLKSPIVIEVLDDAAFDEAFRADIEPRPGAQMARAGDEPDLYFVYYGSRKRTVLLRKNIPDWAKGIDPRPAVAHEIEHALQDQYWPIDELFNARQVDVGRGHFALIEGDAEVAALGAVALLDGLPPKRAIVRDTDPGDAVPSDTITDVRPVNPQAARASEREEVFLPRDFGVTFVGALFRAGGFDLVNKAFSHPPSSSAEILHPEAYLAGRVAHPVTLAADPPGYAPDGARGSMGELILRNTLVHWGTPLGAAAALASAWRGDSFAMAQGPAGKTASWWTLVFDDETSAAKLLPLFAAHGLARQTGRVLAFAVGFPEAVATSLVTRGAAGVAKDPPPPSAPFGKLTVPPPPPLLEETMHLFGVIDDRARLRSEPLGLVIALPHGMTAQPNPAPTQPFVGVFTGGHAAAVLSVDSFRPTDTHIDALKRGVTSGFAGYDYGEPEDGRATTPFGPASERRWNTASGIHLRYVVMSICEKEASLAALISWRDGGETSGKVLETWLASLDPSHVDASPFCKAVKLERTTDLP